MENIGVKNFFKSKNILLTGCTGFVGKVMLEKIMRSLPDSGNIYLLVREKRGKTRTQRLKEILASRGFLRLKRVMGEREFEQWALQKIIPIQGDLIIDGLGLSPEDRARVTENVHLVINCAASVNFDDPLHDALEINYFGCMKMMDLAKECKNIQAFCHVSTTYVNSNTVTEGEQFWKG